MNNSDTNSLFLNTIFSNHSNEMKMTTTALLTLIIIGIITGAVAGLLGIGGAIIMVPALVFIMGLGQHQAQGTSLAVMLPPVGIIAAYNYYKAGEVNLKYALILAVAFIVGSYFGSKLALNIPQRMLQKIFALVLLLISVKMLFSK
ncbi:MAG TPA: sulfite exporter TauE/SafE family protein [Bacteroidales bacterium]|nr:sulfite exporter TauE/SafE family protein [Bacteroidales bacterium]MDI9552603.1 sulfite exporter TauE/SafE family protein [Bacteroidota bacterium]MBP7037839.1 sulfite exporter TauE/SafE family protein [Bacteroidales bacterium]MZP65837.1 TSUP family transporter [Bacteroidales bacterium]NLK55635.1 sulfite exporter TauE/SafE family protein [Bacteroidales bacterium]